MTGGFRISVGMTETDLKRILDPESGEDIDLAKGGQTEEWTYWADLNLGVLIEDGKVKGITVTPVE